MNKLFLPAVLLVGSLSLFASDKHPRSGINISTNDSDSMDCEGHLHMQGDDRVVVRGEESRSLPNQPLKVVAATNGGIQIRTGNRADFEVKLCKAAAADSAADAQRFVSDVHIAYDAGTLTVNSPRSGENTQWSGLLLIEAPAGATVDLKAHNGGISLRKFDGKATAHTTNGGIALKQTSGEANVESTNGGVSIQDCHGKITANVQNGGVSIRLAETWSGPGLDAHVQNGGLVVELPRNLQTSMELRASEHTPILCKASACEGAQRTWGDDGKVFRVGPANPSGATPVIRASTVNGGVVIQSRDREMD